VFVLLVFFPFLLCICESPIIQAFIFNVLRFECGIETYEAWTRGRKFKSFESNHGGIETPICRYPMHLIETVERMIFSNKG
jgi:hypothetical protein